MIRRSLTLVSTAVLLAVGTTTTAEAAPPRAANGDRCTIVGTGGPDVLRGTSGRDVICGLGGNDVLRGLGGNDVLDEGSGRGSVYGGTGNDTLYGGRDGDLLSGGTGTDRLSGGLGADDLDGGWGDDRLAGGTGDDEVDGGAGNDRVAGEEGADRLAGGDGRDAVSGGDGNDVANGGDGTDTVAGGSGRDTVAGGAGNDVLNGDADGDRLLGGNGNDDLDGGPGADGLDGGAGTNWCVVGAGDTQKACVYDKTAPRVLAVQALPGAVDVTDAARDVVLRAHIVDDTGVDWAFLSVGHAETNTDNKLVSGTVRDGWWETTVRVLRYSPAASYPAHVQVQDRVGRVMSERFEDVLSVSDDNPDTTGPVVSDLHVSPAEIDVRKAGASITVTVRITDDVSGLHSAHVAFKTADSGGVFEDDPVASAPLERVTGTARDGRYRAVVQVGKGRPGGLWSLDVSVTDVAWNNSTYFGQDLWRYVSGGAAPGPMTLAGGRVLVTGSTLDSSTPELVEARVHNPSVDTLPGPVAVTVDLHLRDSGDGVMVVDPLITMPGLQIFGRAEQLSGTIFDGWWRATLTLPQGLPPGSYLPTFSVADRHNSAGFVGPAGGGPSGTFRTNDGSAWDGSITVVSNPDAPPSA